MNKTTFIFASRLAFLSLAASITISFTACSSDAEPTIDEVLSKDTTPIDFELTDFSRYDKYILFDYAGSNYVKSDTASQSKCTVNLRQGKHHIIWVRMSAKDNFNPEDKTITIGEHWQFPSLVNYTEMDFEVSPYLMPVKQVNWENSVMCVLGIQITDIDETLKHSDIYEEDCCGRITGLPFVKKVSLTSDYYETDKDLELRVFAVNGNSNSTKKDSVIVMASRMFCPVNGLNNIQLKTEAQDENGNLVTGTTIPKFSLKRGHTTILRGPLFSGTTADWKVTIQ